MRTLVEELEGLDARLRKTDPGDVAILAALLEKRGAALGRLEEMCACGEANQELLQRLQAISQEMADVYRGVVLERLLLVQQQAMLERKRALLASVSRILDQPRSQPALNEEG